MRLLETGNEKVKKICEVLKKETLEPARLQAEEILELARKEADRLIKQAQDKSHQLVKETEERIKKQEEVFKASVNIAFKQVIGKLKSEIETKLFHPALLEVVRHHLSSSATISDSIKVIIDGLAKSGLDADAKIILSKKYSSQQLAEVIAAAGVENWKNKIYSLGDFGSGLQIRLDRMHMIIDLTDGAVEQMLLEFASDNLKKIIFNR